VFVGHDWGGLLVWPLARLHPDRVAGVVGVNTPDFRRPHAPPVELLRRLSPDQPVYIVQFQDRGAAEFFIHNDVDGFMRAMLVTGPVTVNKDAFPPEVVRVFADTFRADGAITPPLEYYRNMDRNWELTASIDGVKIEVPCLMISAENDPVLTPAMTAGMEDRIPDLEKVVIANCGHWTQQERPAETNAHLLRYLRRLPRWD
jgi:pimeloyl-ACP methyl ester carboxylesterase